MEVSFDNLKFSVGKRQKDHH